MEYEIEFKLIDIKDINKIQRVEEVKDSTFGEAIKVECKHDIADEYCRTAIQCAIEATNIECEFRYIGCTDRIGHYEFEITKDDVKYVVILQQDTYEWKLQLTIQIGYKTPADKEKLKNEYDTFLEKLKLCIKNKLEGLMATIKSDIYSDSMAFDAEIQKEIKRRCDV